MRDEVRTREGARRSPSLPDILVRPPANPSVEEGEEDSCPAFGYLRGRERALTLELRLRTGDIEAFPYSWLGPVRFNPSVGLLLKFTGDVVYAVLIRGSHLDELPPGRAVNLTDRGIFRHRVVWVREMDQDEIKKLPAGEPSIDEVVVAECSSDEAFQEWTRLTVPEFARH